MYFFFCGSFRINLKQHIIQCCLFSGKKKGEEYTISFLISFSKMLTDFLYDLKWNVKHGFCVGFRSITIHSWAVAGNRKLTFLDLLYPTTVTSHVFHPLLQATCMSQALQNVFMWHYSAYLHTFWWYSWRKMRILPTEAGKSKSNFPLWALFMKDVLPTQLSPIITTL